ncbi:MAG: DNA recombination protein RmuC [Deltaproteobacteria bacterium]|nr:DNA recombination protein RmuC [Deltaproteobacteria bacterium]
MTYVLIFIGGFLLGAIIVFVIQRAYKKDSRDVARELAAQDVELMISRVRDSFGAISSEVLSQNAGNFLKIAGEALSKQTELGDKELEHKKKLIDQTLDAMKSDLKGIQDVIVALEKDREKKFGEISSHLKTASEETSKLQETARELRQALSSTKARGQWGERMAEDVLRLAGFIEGINYRKQKSLDSAGSRPDYTFFLPHDLKVNMDVKFPLDNYLRFVGASSETERDSFKTQFLRDAKSRIKEVITRDYINPEDNTVDYVIVFIPNEQVYAFMIEHDNTLMDEALKQKVILCSPFTLYAILAVIRQAVDNFNLEKTASRILTLLGNFHKQWDAFVKSFERMGKRIEDTQKEYENLTTTRRNQLERSLKQIEELRLQQGGGSTEITGEDKEGAIDIEEGTDQN